MLFLAHHLRVTDLALFVLKCVPIYGESTHAVTSFASNEPTPRDHASALMDTPAKVKSPVCFLVRCVANKSADQWQVFSLEFGLAAQADTFGTARRKMESMIQSYLHDVLVGEDREHARELLARRAPWWVFAWYYQARVRETLRHRSRNVKSFLEPWGYAPQLLRHQH